MLIRIKKKQKDRNSREKIKNSEFLRSYCKFMRLRSVLKLDVSSYINYQRRLVDLPKSNRSISYCYLTGRSRGVFRDFRLSRHQIREKFKYLHGLTNSSW